MRRFLFLSLALVCLLGLVAIFVVDGYMGIYDTIRTTAGEFEQVIEPDSWSRYYYQPSVDAIWDSKVFFVYEIDNRRLSAYATTIQASLWQENEKIMDLLTAEKAIKPFDEATVEWTVDPEELESRGFTEGQYTVKIEREGAERKIVVSYYIPTSPQYPTNVPPPRPVE